MMKEGNLLATVDVTESVLVSPKSQSHLCLTLCHGTRLLAHSGHEFTDLVPIKI